MGSVHYLPPEQANGQGATIKSDIYSLGILMFELITGHVPFKGDNAVEIALKQMKEPLPSVCKINPDVPQSVENIILRACAKNPKNRYDSVREMYSDINVCLDEDRPEEKRVVYKYPEDDIEATKTLTNLKEITREARHKDEEKKEEAVKEEMEEVKEEKQKSKKLNVALWITGVLVALIAVALVVVVFVIPAVTQAKDVKIPDVSGLSVEKAEKKLLDAGLKVDVEVEEKESDEIEEGDVIETSPKANRTVKEGQTIKLTVSLGEVKIEIENYVDKNYLEVKGSLETLGLVVKVEKKDVEQTDDKKYKADIIIEQSVKKGEKLKKDDEIILYIPNILVKYPDFTTGYTVDQVKQWCETNSIQLTITEQATSSHQVGTIISQSRTVDDVVVANAKLTITVAKAPESTTTIPSTDGSLTEDK